MQSAATAARRVADALGSWDLQEKHDAIEDLKWQLQRYRAIPPGDVGPVIEALQIALGKTLNGTLSILCLECILSLFGVLGDARDAIVVDAIRMLIPIEKLNDPRTDTRSLAVRCIAKGAQIAYDVSPHVHNRAAAQGPSSAHETSWDVFLDLFLQRGFQSRLSRVRYECLSCILEMRRAPNSAIPLPPFANALVASLVDSDEKIRKYALAVVIEAFAAPGVSLVAHSALKKQLAVFNVPHDTLDELNAHLFAPKNLSPRAQRTVSAGASPTKASPYGASPTKASLHSLSALPDRHPVSQPLSASTSTSTSTSTSMSTSPVRKFSPRSVSPHKVSPHKVSPHKTPVGVASDGATPRKVSPHETPDGITSRRVSSSNVSPHKNSPPKATPNRLYPAKTKHDSPVFFDSPRDMAAQVEKMVVHFHGKETEENWSHREKSVLRLAAFVRSDYAHDPDFRDPMLRALAILRDGILKGMLSLRTTLAIASLALLGDMALAFRTALPSIEIYLNHCIQLTGQTKKLVASAAQSTAMNIVDASPFNPRIPPLLASSLSDKAAQLRQMDLGIINHYLNTLAHAHSDRSLHTLLDPLIFPLSKSLSDATPPVREQARAAYILFVNHWPSLAASIYAYAAPPARKVLDKVHRENSSIPNLDSASTHLADKTLPDNSLPDKSLPDKSLLEKNVFHESHSPTPKKSFAPDPFRAPSRTERTISDDIPERPSTRMLIARARREKRALESQARENDSPSAAAFSNISRASTELAPHSRRPSPLDTSAALHGIRSSAGSNTSEYMPRSPGYMAPLSPGAAAPLSPGRAASGITAPLSPRLTAPLSPLSPGHPPPLSPRHSAPLSPRHSAPLSPRHSAPLSATNDTLSPHHDPFISNRDKVVDPPAEPPVVQPSGDMQDVQPPVSSEVPPTSAQSHLSHSSPTAEKLPALPHSRPSPAQHAETTNSVRLGPWWLESVSLDNLPQLTEAMLRRWLFGASLSIAQLAAIAFWIQENDVDSDVADSIMLYVTARLEGAVSTEHSLLYLNIMYRLAQSNKALISRECLLTVLAAHASRSVAVVAASDAVGRALFAQTGASQTPYELMRIVLGAIDNRSLEPASLSLGLDLLGSTLTRVSRSTILALFERPDQALPQILSQAAANPKPQVRFAAVRVLSALSTVWDDFTDMINRIGLGNTQATLILSYANSYGNLET